MKLGTFLALLDDTEENHCILEYIHSAIAADEGHVRGLWAASSPKHHLGTMEQGLPIVVIDKITNELIEETKSNQKIVEGVFDRWCKHNQIEIIDNFAYESIAENPKITASFLTHVGEPQKAIAQIGRVSDFIVASRSQWLDSEEKEDYIHAAIFETARPVILLPKEYKSKPIENIAIAWNGKLEASHAIARAKPFLKRAKNVYIYIAPSARTQIDIGEGLEFYLSQHGVYAQIVEIERDGSNVGAAMLKQATEHQIDMIVMGAWSRSRLRQLILGGLTSYMMENATIPVMMAR
ncbi:MAG: universal stress protein [Alphaproteobacteria bacterium]